jgi:hypothetical protein
VALAAMGCGWWMERRERQWLQIMREEDIRWYEDSKAEINATVRNWHFNTGKWPKDDLSDIGADEEYFPGGMPTNPLTKSSFKLNPRTHQID